MNYTRELESIKLSQTEPNRKYNEIKSSANEFNSKCREKENINERKNTFIKNVYDGHHLK